MKRAIRWIPILLFSFGAQAAAESGLPGVEPFETSLAARVRQELEAQGKDYVPRTRHLHDNMLSHVLAYRLDCFDDSGFWPLNILLWSNLVNTILNILFCFLISSANSRL